MAVGRGAAPRATPKAPTGGAINHRGGISSTKGEPPAPKPKAPAKPKVVAPKGGAINHRGGVSSTKGEPKAPRQPSPTEPVTLIPKTGPPAKPFAKAQRQANQKVHKVLKTQEQNITLPASGPALDTAARHYNIHTKAQVDALPAPARQAIRGAQQRLNQSLTKSRVTAATSATTRKLPKGYRQNGDLVMGPNGLPLSTAGARAVSGEATVTKRFNTKGLSTKQKAKLGAGVEKAQRSRLKEGPHKSLGGKGLAVIEPALAGNPLSAFVKGTERIPVAGQAIRNTPGDLLNLPANAVTGTYHLATTAVHDPKKAVKEFAQSYTNIVKHPKEALEHPVPTYLMLAGVKGAIGHTAGDVARSGVLGKTVRAAGDTERGAKTLPGTSVVQKRQYSRDLITKGRQVVTEKSRVKSAVRLEKKAGRTVNEGAAEDLQQQAHANSKVQVTPRELRRRFDERTDANNTMSRANRTEIGNKVTSLKVGKHGPLVSLVAQRIVKPDVHDVRAYREELVGARGNLSPARLRANKALVKSIDKALAGKQDMAEVARKADGYIAATRAGRDALVDAKVLSKDQADRRELMPYAVRNMGAHHDGERLVNSSGDELTTGEIRAHMLKHIGQSEAAFLTQAPNRRGAGNFFKSDSRPAQIGNKSFTGKATRQGTFDAHPDTLRENAANTQSLVDQQAGFKSTLHEFGLRKGGKLASFGTRAEAEKAIEDHTHIAPDKIKPGAIKWRVVRVNPFGASHEQLEQLLRPDHHGTHEAISSALSGSGEGPFAVIPDTVAARQMEHLRVMGGGPGKAVQKFTGTFRKAVLATSPKWLFGNGAEAGVRSLIMKAGPLSYITAHRILDTMEEKYPEAAKELKARMGGGHFTMADKFDLHRGAEQFEHTDLKPVADRLEKFWRSPGPKQAAGAWHAYTNLVFHKVNAPIETKFQTAMMGKAIRKGPLMSHRLSKLSEAAINDAAKGLVDTNNQVEMVREIHRAYGKYNAFGPPMKRAIGMYTPFIPWTINALHFALMVMPKDHPILTSAIVAAEQASDEWLKTAGLKQVETGALPAFLQGSIPSGSGHLQVSRYTPFGAFSDLPGTIGGGVLPQFRGAMDAATLGVDWKGAKLKDQSALGRTNAALASLVEGIIPGYGQMTSVQKKGLAGLNPLATIKSSGGGSSDGILPQSVLDKLDTSNLGGSLSQKQLDAIGG